jgi:hypothetical protein
LIVFGLLISSGPTSVLFRWEIPTVKHCTRCLMLLAIVFLSGCGANSTFHEVSSPDGFYKVKIIGTVQVIPGASVGSIETVAPPWNMVVVVKSLGGSTATMDKLEQAKEIGLAMRAYATTFRATAKPLTAVTLNGFLGGEVELAAPAGPDPASGKTRPATTLIVRYFLINEKSLTAVVGSTKTISASTPEVKTFFDSLQLNVTANSSGGAAPGMHGMPGMHNSMPPAGTAQMPGMHGAMPPPTASTMPGMAPPGTMPTASNPAALMHGMPPMGIPGGTPGVPAGTYNSGAAATTPMPAGTAPSGTYSSGGTGLAGMPPVNMPMATMPPIGTIPTNTGIPAAAGTYNSGTPATAPMATAGIPGVNATLPGMNPMNTFPGQPGIPGQSPMPGQPGAPGEANQLPAYTGTPVGTSKLKSGTIVQIFDKGNWVDVKVQEAYLSGLVLVQTQTKPATSGVVPRELLQFAPGVSAPAVASNDRARTSSASLPSSSTPAAPRAVKTAKAATPAAAKADSSKASGLISLEGAEVEDLLKIIGNKTEHRRVQAAEKLRDLSDAGPNPIIAKKLIELLKVDEIPVRAAVANALEKWYSPEVNEAVLKNLTASTAEVRQSMMRILSANKIDGAAAGIAKRLADQDDRKVAIETLVVIGESAQAPVIEMLRHKDSKAKLAACDVLKEIGTADGLAALKKATETWTGTDRLAARKAMQALEAKK